MTSVRSGDAEQREQVQGTCESDERPEHKRGARNTEDPMIQNVSPYIEREAAKLRLVHSAPPPSATKIGSLADHNPRDFYYPRTQREAGIEHLEWEERIQPIRPIWAFVIAAGCWGILALAMAWSLSAL
jgi:hypothetical protein